MRVAVSLLIAVLIVAPCRAALIPPSFSQAVVAIGFVKTTMETGKLPVSEWVTVGTGFFYGAQIKDDPDPTKQQFETYLGLTP